ncbi:MAG: hypothetical protein IK100_03320 [Muribaculaceae bacterium]|nr:hypothetical protein [Muribaculaceae bacterium]
MKKLITYSIVALCVVFLNFNYSEAKTRKNGKSNVKRSSSIYTPNSIPDVFNLASYENYIKKNGVVLELETTDERYSLTSYKNCFISKDNVVFKFYKKLKKGNSPIVLEIIIPIDDYDDGVELYKTLQSLISQKYGIDYDSTITGYDNYSELFFSGYEVLLKRNNREIGITTSYDPNFSDTVDSKYVITVCLGPFKTN